MRNLTWLLFNIINPSLDLLLEAFISLPCHNLGFVVIAVIKSKTDDGSNLKQINKI